MKVAPAIRETALRAAACGISVVPPRQDGSKAPSGAWRDYQQTPPSDDQLGRWYGRSTGVGFVTGAVSGGLELLEFDDAETYQQFKETASEVGLGELVDRIEGGYHEVSPSGGVHWLYRCSGLRGSTKLASRPGPRDPGTRNFTRKTLIETKGEGGYVIVAPSYGRVHPTGQPYRLLRGGIETIASITEAERDELWQLARSYDETAPLPKRESTSTPAQNRSAEQRSGDDYIARVTWPEILEPHGWRRVYTRGETTYWRRSGKATGISATTGHGGHDLLFVFSTSTEVEAKKGYNKFSTYVMLNHRGDFGEATKALAEKGYGRDARRNGRADDGGRVAPVSPDSDEDATPLETRRWPAPPDEASYHGLAGEIVRTIEPSSEADPLGLLVQLLVMFGSALGRGPYYTVESTNHHANEFIVLVGETSQGRKGTSADRIRALFADVDPEWSRSRIHAGLSSGEGMISAVRDPVWAKQAIKEEGRVAEYQDVMVDEGVSDKRLLILETEFGGVLRVLERDGNKLSALIRQGWDHGNLVTLTKNPFRATDAHVSIIGHITVEELLALLSRTDADNGFANRFLWLAVRRSKILPHGGQSLDMSTWTTRLSCARAEAREVGRMAMSDSARTLWESHYERLTTPPPGVLGRVTSRAAPHALRLAMLYALLDGTAVIASDHLAAGLALWDASARCAAYIFGDSLGNPDASKILAALRAAPSGLTRSQIRESVFQRNCPAPRIKEALGMLLQNNLIREDRDVSTGGRPAYRYSVSAIGAERLTPDPGVPTAPPPYGVNGVNGVPPTNANTPLAATDREVFEL
jgi:hypothetical protein